TPRGARRNPGRDGAQVRLRGAEAGPGQRPEGACVRHPQRPAPAPGRMQPLKRTEPSRSACHTARMQLRFDNAFLRELPGDPLAGPGVRQVQGAAWSRVAPTPVAAPRLVAHAAEVAAQLGVDADDVASPSFARVFGGNRLLEGMDPWAANYGGHQVGPRAGQVRGGRGDRPGGGGGGGWRRERLQVKGGGATPYSRGGEGRAVLGSSIREFLCSEAMHHLGVPTTRALSLVAT